MARVVRETAAMLAGMTPVLKAGQFVFCTTTDADVAGRMCAEALGWFREGEGPSAILPLERAAALGFDTTLPMRWIELQVFSALDGVGLTAAVAAVLAAENIPCNMVAAYHHDHVFVPADQAQRAVALLMSVQAQAGSAETGTGLAPDD